MAQKYYKSDFQVQIGLSVTRQSGTETVPITTATDFKFRFYVGALNGDGYLASRTGNALKNCTIVDDKHVIVYFDRTQMELPVGNLMLEAEFIIPDAHYEGDQICNIKRLYSTGISLTNAADTDSEGVLNIDLETPVVYVPTTPDYSALITRIETLESSLAALQQKVDNNETIVATSLTDLDERLDVVEEHVL